MGKQSYSVVYEAKVRYAIVVKADDKEQAERLADAYWAKWYHTDETACLEGKYIPKSEVVVEIRDNGENLRTDGLNRVVGARGEYGKEGSEDQPAGESEVGISKAT